MSDRHHDPIDVTRVHDHRHDRWLECAAAYALDALDDAECEGFEAHLDDCAACRRAVQEYREVSGLLMHASEPVAVPPGLGARVGAMLAAERESMGDGIASGGAVSPGAHRSRGGDDAAVVSLADRAARPGAGATRPWRGPAAWLAAAALAFAAVSGVLWRQVQQERARVAVALEAMGEERAARDSLLENLRGARVHVVSLAAPGGGAPVARVFWNHERNTYVVTAFGLPRAPQGRTYQLWAVVKGRDPVSMGTFDTDANGVAMVVIPVNEAINRMGVIDLCALTEEPAGGSPGPTEAPRYAGEWRHTD